MEKQKRWQLYLIIAVIALTLYNILPTVFFYTKPLKSPVDETRASAIAHEIVGRVNELENDSVSWLESFTKHIGVHPSSIKIDEKDPSLVTLKFEKNSDANLFRQLLPQAGAMIPFVPSQLEVYSSAKEDPKSVVVLRQIGIRLDDKDIPSLFKYAEKYEKGSINPLYRSIVNDRVAALLQSFGGESAISRRMRELEHLNDEEASEKASQIAKEIIDNERALGKSNPIFKRWLQSIGSSEKKSGKELIAGFITKSELLQGALSRKEETLSREIKRATAEEALLSGAQEESLKLVQSQKKALNDANEILKKNADLFLKTEKPLTQEAITKLLKESQKASKNETRQTVALNGTNPFIEALVIDWSNDKINLEFYPDIQKIRTGTPASENEAFVKDKVGDLIINDIARASSISDESIQPSGDTFAVSLSTLTNPYAILGLDLGTLAEKMGDQFLYQIKTGWSPKHPDFAAKNYPVSTYSEFKKLSKEDQKLGLVVYVPATETDKILPDLKKGSIYIIARGIESIASTYRDNSKAEGSAEFSEDIKNLAEMLRKSGFIAYPGASLGSDSMFAKDYIFELEDYYSNIVKATRENFVVKGSKRYAVLDLTDVEQRILTENRIDDRTQEDLLKWKDEYQASLVSQNPHARLLVPPPTENPYIQNFKISLAKYFRGDDRKILKWGLDLSGGKTVRIGLRDANGQPVTNPDDLKQAVNELYTRINKMGVSERTIRIENNNIVLDFPSSQGLSAAELIKASSMHFHIVNEKFSQNNPEMKEAISAFLQQVWNEAVVTNRKDVESINEIAWKHLGGDETTDSIVPRGENAKFLYEHGLKLANLRTHPKSHAFDDTLSSIAVLKGDDFSDWYGQTNPLMVVFHNYALDGASLTDVQVGYDPKDGNVLSFQVKGSYDKAEGNPRSDFYAWTSQFAQDQIRGTPKATYSKGEGWRMAVILNGRVISMPSLKAALREGGSISGRFSQREIDQLAADLKAGSLTFTPRILSEQNVSPELGKEERTKGIAASIIAVVLVVALMCGYYRFAGLVACIAVLFNILIMWGVLQNLGAALTLPGIAGIVLTIGMAVDANVLVFERYKEEYKISGRVGSAIQAAYNKAFSAIVDSNVTTIIAALILLQFDSGPIKGFAITLIIGIISSMFTALFMTRYFFAWWVKRHKDKPFNMASWIGQTNFNFLAQTKKAVLISLALILLGSYFFISQRNNIFGMDFLGGYALTVEFKEDPAIESYRLQAKEALVNAGLQSSDVDVRQLSRANQLKIQLSTTLEELGGVFHGMPELIENEGGFAYRYEANPRLSWLVSALKQGGLTIPESQLKQIDSNWTVMSGQFSDTMRNNAVIALFLALISILVYITLRFEFKYAIAAVIGLAHDLLITVGIVALFNKLGFPVQINLEVIGALMTIIGYSLNDTIIVFDRIREELKLHRKWKFEDVVNYALNVTLSRTMMTSGTTLLVLLALVLFGGKSIFGFSLVMTIGVIVGTLSSLFIAAPVLIYFHNREEKQLNHDKTAIKQA